MRFSAAGTPRRLAGPAALVAAAGLWALPVAVPGSVPGSGTVAAADAPAEKLAVKRIFPVGGAAGSSVVVKAEGAFPRWPVRVWTDRGGTTWTPREEKGSFDVAIAAGASGVHRLRIHDDREAAAIHHFVVGSVPEIVEAEPNDKPQEPQGVSSLPVTVSGVLEKAGDVDGYGIALEAGQTLVAAIDARDSLRSPIDAVLEIVDDRGGYAARNLDARGLDPRIVFKAPRGGRYVVRVYGFPAEPNSTIGYAGGADHVYRLTLSTGGFVAAALPAAIARTGTTMVAASGWNLPAGLAAAPFAAESAGASGDQVWATFPGVAGAVPLPIVAAGSLTVLGAGPAAAAVPPSERVPPSQQAPPREPAPASEPPITASGIFRVANETLVQRVAAKKAQPLLVGVEALAIGSEAEAVLDVRGADGRSVLSKSDRDPPAAWTPPADGEYSFSIRERRGSFGPAHFFRLTILPAEPKLEASCDAEIVSGKPDAAIELPITVERLRGFKEPVEFVLVDPPAGLAAEPVTSAAEGDSAKKVTLSIKPTAAWSGPLRVLARRPRPAEGAPGNAAAEPVAAVRFGKQKLAVVWVTVAP